MLLTCVSCIWRNFRLELQKMVENAYDVCYQNFWNNGPILKQNPQLIIFFKFTRLSICTIFFRVRNYPSIWFYWIWTDGYFCRLVQAFMAVFSGDWFWISIMDRRKELSLAVWWICSSVFNETVLTCDLQILWDRIVNHFFKILSKLARGVRQCTSQILAGNWLHLLSVWWQIEAVKCK